MENYININKHAWDLRTEVHIESEFYDMSSFLAGENTLKDIELALLGDIRGKKILHLQCHFGQDTISLARLGASVTGVDFSDKAILKARELATITQTDAQFICCDLYELPQHLDEQFDIVFSSYGTIGWLPDMSKWADIVARYIKPGGLFVFAEFHPVIWMFDNDFKSIAYRYFKDAPIVEDTTGTYTNQDAPISYQEISWNHSLSEVLGNLLQKNLQLIHFQEYDYSPYPCFKDGIAIGEGKYQIAHLGNKIPMVYALAMRK